MVLSYLSSRKNNEFVMMSYQSESQPTLFCYIVNLAKRVPQKRILRRIKERIHFDFIYAEVRDTYGTKGNPSVPPPTILKMLLLLVLYNLRSEQELMDTIPMRLDRLGKTFFQSQLLVLSILITADHP